MSKPQLLLHILIGCSISGTSRALCQPTWPRSLRRRGRRAPRRRNTRTTPRAPTSGAPASARTRSAACTAASSTAAFRWVTLCSCRYRWVPLNSKQTYRVKFLWINWISYYASRLTQKRQEYNFEITLDKGNFWFRYIWLKQDPLVPPT